MNMINGVAVYPRKKFCTDQGCIYKWVQPDDPFFEQFGEVYFSSIVPGVVKGWNLHAKLDANMVCVVGSIKIVLCDRRPDSSTVGAIKEVTMGSESYNLLHIPHGVAFSWKVLGKETALLGNFATEPYEAGELTKIDITSAEIPYQWDLQ